MVAKQGEGGIVHASPATGTVQPARNMWGTLAEWGGSGQGAFVRNMQKPNGGIIIIIIIIIKLF